MPTIQDFCAANNVRLEKVYIGLENDGKWPHHVWSVTVRCGGKSFRTEYKAGTGHDPRKGPTVEEVVDSLVSDADSTDRSFEEWASDFGLDPDSRSAERTYNECRKVARGLERLFGVDKLAELCACERL